MYKKPISQVSRFTLEVFLVELGSYTAENVKLNECDTNWGFSLLQINCGASRFLLTYFI